MKRRRKESFTDKVGRFFANLKNEFSALSTPQQVIIWIVAAVFIVSIIAVGIVVTMNSGNTDDTDIDSDSISISDDSSYEPDDFVIDPTTAPKTILTETEDAGDDYLKESMFVGDSNTVGFASNGFLPLENVVGVESMGIQGVPTLSCVYYQGETSARTIPYAVKAQQPRRVFICYGTNNLIGVSTEQFIAAYIKSVNSIIDAYEYCDIIVVTIPPLAKVHENQSISQKTVDKFNIALVEMADEQGWKILNTTELLKGNDGYMKAEYVSASDGIHLVKTGHEAILKYAKNHSFVGEDIRPKPLKAQPKRKNAPPKESSSSSSSSSVTSTDNAASEREKLKAEITSSITLYNSAVVSVDGTGNDVSKEKKWVSQVVQTAFADAITSANAYVVKTDATPAELINARTALVTVKATFKPAQGIGKTDEEKAKEGAETDRQNARNALGATITTVSGRLGVADGESAETVAVGITFLTATDKATLNAAINSAKTTFNNVALTVAEYNSAKDILNSISNGIATKTGTKQPDPVIVP